MAVLPVAASARAARDAGDGRTGRNWNRGAGALLLGWRRQRSGRTSGRRASASRRRREPGSGPAGRRVAGPRPRSPDDRRGRRRRRPERTLRQTTAMKASAGPGLRRARTPTEAEERGGSLRPGMGRSDPPASSRPGTGENQARRRTERVRRRPASGRIPATRRARRDEGTNADGREASSWRGSEPGQQVDQQAIRRQRRPRDLLG